jgi:hypothetical protein
MSTGESAGPIHHARTRRNNYQYLFYQKHHGRGGDDAACWLPEIGHDEEFAIFDAADFNEISDPKDNLFGVRGRRGDGKIGVLGKFDEHVAEFPYARPEQPWHGYPVWPLSEEGPQNRRGDDLKPHSRSSRRWRRPAF